MKRVSPLVTWGTLGGFWVSLVLGPSFAHAFDSSQIDLNRIPRMNTSPCASPTVIDTTRCSQIDLSPNDEPFVLQFQGQNYETWLEKVTYLDLPIDRYGRRRRGTGQIQTSHLLKVRINGRKTKTFTLLSHWSSNIGGDGPDDTLTSHPTRRLTFADARGVRGVHRFRFPALGEATENLSRFNFEVSRYEIRVETPHGPVLVQEEEILSHQNAFVAAEADARSGRERHCLWLKGTPGVDYTFEITQHIQGKRRQTVIDIPSHNASYLIEGTVYCAIVTGLDGDRVRFMPNARASAFKFFDAVQMRQDRRGDGPAGGLGRLSRGLCDPRFERCDDSDSVPPINPGEFEPARHEVRHPAIEAGLLMFEYPIGAIRGSYKCLGEGCEGDEEAPKFFVAGPDPFAVTGNAILRAGDLEPIAVSFSVPQGTRDFEVKYYKTKETPPPPEPAEGDTPPPPPPEPGAQPEKELFATYILKNACGHVPMVTTPDYYLIHLTFENIPADCFVDSSSDSWEGLVSGDQSADPTDDGEEGDGDGGSRALSERRTQKDLLEDNLNAIIFPERKDCAVRGGDDPTCETNRDYLRTWLENADAELMESFDESTFAELAAVFDDWTAACLFPPITVICLIVGLVGAIGCGIVNIGPEDDCGHYSISAASRKFGIVVSMGEGILDMSVGQANHMIRVAEGANIINLPHGNHVIIMGSGHKSVQTGFGVKRILSHSLAAGRIRDEEILPTADVTLYDCGVHECQIYDGDGDAAIIPSGLTYRRPGPSGGCCMERDLPPLETTINYFRLGEGTHFSAFGMSGPENPDDCWSVNSYSSNVPDNILDVATACWTANTTLYSDSWVGWRVLTDSASFGETCLQGLTPDSTQYGRENDNPTAAAYTAMDNLRNPFRTKLISRIYGQTPESLSEPEPPPPQIVLPEARCE